MHPWLRATGSRLLIACCSLPLPAQALLRHVEELGDPERSEAAEQQLIAAGTKGAAALQPLLENFETATPRDLERLRAALRVVHLLGETAADLGPVLEAQANNRQKPIHRELLLAIGSLAPYFAGSNWHVWWSGSHSGDLAMRTDAFVLTARLNSRGQTKLTDAEQSLRLLERDQMFIREVAAEHLGQLRAQEAIEPLARRLRERSRPSADAAQLLHNGFVLEYPDQFALRAAQALVRIAPDDPRAAIGYAVLAAEHPHRARRLDALRKIAMFAPEAHAAIGDLMSIAEGADPGLAAEALKVLGLLGEEVGRELHRIEALANSEKLLVARLAGALATRLRAMGCEPQAATIADAAPPSPPPGILAAIEVLTKSQSDAAARDAAVTTLQEEAAASWPLLVTALRQSQQPRPEQLIEAIGRIGSELDPATTQSMRYAIANTGDTWNAPRWSASSGGRQLRRCDWIAYAELEVGRPSDLTALLPKLRENNAPVRLIAAQRLFHRSADFAQLPADDRETITSALLAAVRDDHPTQSSFRSGPNRTSSLRAELTAEIRAMAAAGLLSAELEPALHGELLRALRSHPDLAVVVRGIHQWGPAAATADLNELTESSHAEVVKAATAVLAARGNDK